MLLNKSGYDIPKKIISEQQLNKIREELTVTPCIGSEESGDESQSFKVYKENDEHMIVPKFYGIKKFGEPKKVDIGGKKVNFKFTKQLRDKQKPIVEQCLAKLKNNGSNYGGGGILSVKCGAGKTTMALYIASVLGWKTLVIVHKTFLQEQWIERIKQFTNAKYGTIRQKKIDIKNKDIVIGMLQSISMIDYDSSIFDEFNLIIVDECHHLGARKFSQALAKAGALYTLGLSATPKRQDGLTKVIMWHIGDIIYRDTARINPYVQAKIFHYDTQNKLFAEKKRWIKGKVRPDTVKMTNNICLINERNDFIINIIDELRKCPDRKILVLSGRVKHLQLLKSRIDKLLQKDEKDGKIEIDECKTFYYVGKTTPLERKLAETDGDILFGTFDMAQEGLDIEKLNTVILATPKKNIEQAIGRIMRKIITKNDTKPLIIDICDNMSVFKTQGKGRLKHYSSGKYKIKNYYVYDDKVITYKEHMKNTSELNDNDKVLEYSPNLSTILNIENDISDNACDNNNDNDLNTIKINEESDEICDKKTYVKYDKTICLFD